MRLFEQHYGHKTTGGQTTAQQPLRNTKMTNYQPAFPND